MRIAIPSQRLRYIRTEHTAQSVESFAAQMSPAMIPVQWLKARQEDAYDVQSQMHDIRRCEVNYESLVPCNFQCFNLPA